MLIKHLNDLRFTTPEAPTEPRHCPPSLSTVEHLRKSQLRTELRALEYHLSGLQPSISVVHTFIHR